jgi:hypothetical protein
MLALVAAATVLADIPSASDAERLWRSRLDNSNGLLHMIWFQKSDGKEVPGGYTLYYIFQFSATEDCQFDRGNFKATKGLPQTEMERLAGMFDKVQGHKWQTFTQTGRMLYEKRESGWVLVDDEVDKFWEAEADRKNREAAEENTRKNTNRQQQDAARPKEEPQTHRAALIAKAKEQHRVIKVVWVKDTFLTGMGKKFKLILTDSNLTFETDAGSQSLWFGDMTDAYMKADAKDSYALVIQAPGNFPTPFFRSEEDLKDFYRACQESYTQWHKDNLSLFDK